jgi:flagellar FliL protein
MAEETPTAAPEGGAKPKSKILLVVLGLVGLLGGGAAGAFVAVPLAAGRTAHASAPAKGAHAKEGAGDSTDAEPGDEASADGEGGHDEKATEGPIYMIDNLVLNPAGTGGTRFLMLSVAIELADAAGEEKLKTRDAQLRDALVDLLGEKSVEQLSDARQRDSLRIEVAKALVPLAGKKAIRRVYFPQWVIQ